MVTIQIIALIVFVVSIVAIPVLDQLYFYNAFNFKDALKGTVQKGQTESRDNLKSDKKTADRKIDSNETRETPPVSLENFEVEKHEAKTGSVRSHSRIVERPVEDSIRLREDRVSVERNTVDRPATAADFANFRERDIEIAERAEVPVVSKEARVAEEVSIGKSATERNETIKDTVSKPHFNSGNLNNDLNRS